MSNSARIFIVEDDTSFASFLETILKEEGYITKVFNDPEKALKEIRELVNPSIFSITTLSEDSSRLNSTISFGSLKAIPKASKHGPRLAIVAGASALTIFIVNTVISVKYFVINSLKIKHIYIKNYLKNILVN